MRCSIRTSAFSVILVSAFSVFLTATCAFADSPPDSMYMRDYGGPYSDDCYAMVNGPDGGFVFCGCTAPSDPGTSDVYLTSVDTWGNVLWTRTYGGPGYDTAQDLVACGDGGFLIAGHTDSYGAGLQDVYAIRTDADGDTLWTRTYGGAGYDYGYGADIAFEGDGFVITGYTDSYGAGMGDVYLIGIGADGDTIWTRTFGMSKTDWGTAVRYTSDGGYAILGSTRSFGLGNDDFFFIKTNSSGSLVDFRSYGGAQDDNGEDLRQTSDGGYIMVGNSLSYGTGGDVLVIKTAADFSIQWMENLGHDGSDAGRAVIQTSDNTYIIAGEMWEGGFWSYYAAELAYNGSRYWENTYGGSSFDRAFSVLETPDLGYMLAGYSYSFGDITQALLVRLNGKLPMIKSITDIPNDQGRQVRISWFSTSYDAPHSQYDIYEYSIWRRIDQWWLSGETRQGEGYCAAAAVAPAMFPVLSYPPGKWDYVTTVPAMGELTYNTVVPTLCDSTIAAGMCWSAFCVMAHTSEPTVYFTSFVDSGYSVDNLAPAPPENLHMPTEMELAWDEAPEEDFDYFTVYASVDPDFNEAVLLGYTVDTEFNLDGDIYNYYYVTATDFAGNEGDPAVVENNYADLPVGEVPGAFDLRQASPNPFGGSTVIGFDLPRHAHIALEVIDIEGRVVRTLLDGDRAAGRHSVSWDGRDASGAEVGPGVYFVRMASGRFTATTKVMLLK